MDWQGPRELVNDREFRRPDREGRADQAADGEAVGMDRDDDVPDRAAVKQQLRLVAQLARGFAPQLAAAEVLEQQAEIGLRQSRGDLVAVHGVGGQRNPGAGRKVL